MATVHIPRQLRALAGGEARAEVPGGTLRSVIDALDARWPGMRASLTEGGAIRPELAFAIDGTVVEDGLLAAVPDDAEVFVIPALGGGSDPSAKSAPWGGVCGPLSLRG